MASDGVDHPLACCGVVGGPIAWIRGRRVLRDIAASGGTMGGRSAALVGYVLGIVSALYTLLFIVGGVAYMVIERKP